LVGAESDKIDNIEKEILNAGATQGTLQTSMIALVAWVVIVTLALVAIAVVTFRRWRNNYSPGDNLSRSSGDSNSSGSLSDITEPGSTLDFSQPSTSGASNGGFDDLDIRIADTASPSVHAPNRPSESAVTIPSSSNL